MRAIASALLLACAARALAAEEPPARAAPPATYAVEQRRKAVARELVAIGAELRRAIERGDEEAILARVPEEGLSCNGRLVPKARVARDLGSRQSWLHGVLFGGSGYAPPPRTPSSLAALFQGRGDVVVVVVFQLDPAAGDLGRPCLDFRAEGLGTPGTPFCFERHGDRWWLTESLYACG